MIKQSSEYAQLHSSLNWFFKRSKIEGTFRLQKHFQSFLKMFAAHLDRQKATLKHYGAMNMRFLPVCYNSSFETLQGLNGKE